MFELRLDKATNVVTGTRYYTAPGTGLVTVRTRAGLTRIGADEQDIAQVQVSATTQQAETRRQKPFGEPRGSSVTGWTGDAGFVGGTNDATGLEQVGARYYDVAQGRFISVDPVRNAHDPQRLNPNPAGAVAVRPHPESAAQMTSGGLAPAAPARS
ncbi:hypothetical protein GCM10022255_069120 [Dactylosporangium darangshiense]|uniref:RHS repeat-associated core domain-containing protein n=1 Tax=Dactylosporangium darangshiense TaxID=579108 RepID=A0ABP8DHR5_9ACTN